MGNKNKYKEGKGFTAETFSSKLWDEPATASPIEDMHRIIEMVRAHKEKQAACLSCKPATPGSCPSCRPKALSFETELEARYLCPGCGGPNMVWDTRLNPPMWARCPDCGMVGQLLREGHGAAVMAWEYEDRIRDVNLAISNSKTEDPLVPKLAPQLLLEAAEILDERGRKYDSPGGERSMAQTVRLFNAWKGTDLKASDGWAFQIFLKMVRQAQTKKHQPDTGVDAINYTALWDEELQLEDLPQYDEETPF